MKNHFLKGVLGLFLAAATTMTVSAQKYSADSYEIDKWNTTLVQWKGSEKVVDLTVEPFNKLKNLKGGAVNSKDNLGTFQNVKGIDKVIVGDNFKQMGNLCFANSSVKTVVLPSSMSKIAGGVFQNCKNLNKVVIPEGVENVEWNCFANSGLKVLVLPSTLNHLGNHVITGCKQLQAVYLPVKNPKKIALEPTAIEWINAKNAKLYVPDGSVKKYRKHKGWVGKKGANKNQFKPENILPMSQAPKL